MMKSIFVIAGLAASLAATAANARSFERPTRTVNLAGVNLASEAGQLLAQRKIAAAARAVCGVGNSGDLRTLTDSRNCYRDAVQQAQMQLSRS
jgi:UrcA family protein